ncbi:MAG: cysteine--tRNA ligase [Candidatus Berkelbacteria bacterium]|nr:cysteine--tRNA ligase [Candidatus Berkelbacteria bacterium]
MFIFNTLTRQKEEIKPIEGDTIRIYSCGLTVYDYAHIDNLRKYIFDDLLKRALIYFGYKVKHVMNITDVGHLTSDEDEGEDKIEKGATREGKSAYEIAKFYEKAFVEDLKKLNILLADEMPRATENIKEQIDLIKKLEEKGFTYKTSDGIYFDTSKLSDYGKLARLDIENLKEGIRVEKNPEKKNPTDFALWKLSVPKGGHPEAIAEGSPANAGQSVIASGAKQSRRQMEWPSPWGVGFPGWHLECSAMSTKFLGQPFEIHTGGVDHIPVHHTNEIAQSEAAFDKPLAKYWVHSEHLLEDGHKMAKSAGHFIRLQDLEEKGYSPLDFRYLCLSAKYRSKLDFSYKSLGAAKVARRKINDAYNLAKPSTTKLHPAGGVWSKGCDQALSDDLDTPRALAFIFDNLSKFSKENFEKMDEVLAILEKFTVPEEVEKLVADRQKARDQKDFKKSDEIRSQIKKKGFLVEDSVGGTKIIRI